MWYACRNYLPIPGLPTECDLSSYTRAFRKFNEYQLAKYNQDRAIKLRDVLFMVHAKPKNRAQGKLWKRLVEGELKVPDTWEVALSASQGEDKKKVWTRLLKEGKLG